MEVSELRLARVWDGGHNYRYVPAMTALGTVTYRSGEKVLSADEKPQILLTVSVEDGSLIR